MRGEGWLRRLAAGALLLGFWACLNPETDTFPTAREGRAGSGPTAASAGAGGSAASYPNVEGNVGAPTDSPAGGAAGSGMGSAGTPAPGANPDAGGGVPDSGAGDAGEETSDAG